MRTNCALPVCRGLATSEGRSTKCRREAVTCGLLRQFHTLTNEIVSLISR